MPAKMRRVMKKLEETATTKIPVLTGAPEMDKAIDKGGYALVSSEEIPFTLQLAMQHLQTEAFIAEREIDNQHLTYLKQDAMDGWFGFERASLDLGFCEWDKKWRRLNGQHTAWMRVDLDDPKSGSGKAINWKKIKIRVNKYRLKTEDDFRRLYATFDRGKPRSAGHVTAARLLGREKFAGLTKRDLNCLVAAVRFYRYPRNIAGSERIRADEVIDRVENQEYRLVRVVADYCADLTYKQCPHMAKRVPVVAAMLATFEKAVKPSIEFWDKVRHGGGSATDPSTVLMKFLYQVSCRSDTTLSREKAVSREELYRICLVAWNAFRQGRPVKVLRCPDKRPKVR